jgi:tetratricopeptide (TPR) repeat protein
LEPAARLAFARLGVFVGGCTLEAAEHVCEIELETLSSLVDNNLLRRRDGRFVMLATVRHFAVERLEELGGGEMRRRHAEWLVELAEEVSEEVNRGGDTTGLLDRLQSEHDNIRAALAWSLDEEPELALRLASALRIFWEVRGHFAEGGRWLDEALERATDADPLLLLKAISVSGGIAFRHGDLDGTEERFETQLRLARELGDAFWIARGLSDVGTVAAARDDLESASTLLEESAALFRELDEPHRLGIVLSNLGHIAAQRGDHAHAIEVTEEALSLESGSQSNAAISLYNLGSYCLKCGDLERSREWLERCVALTFELGFKEVMAYALASYVRICLLEGDAVRAAHLAGIADRQLADAGILLQPGEQALFEEAKTAVADQLGDAYAAAHDAAMAAPLEQALDEGNVLAEASASS